MARKVDEAYNFVLVHLIEQKSGIYDKRHPDYARRDKVDLAWEKILMNLRNLVCVYTLYIYIYYNQNL